MSAARRSVGRERDGGATLALAVVIAFALAPLLDGCGSRHVVVAPETAARRNDPAWTITSEPGRAATPAATTPQSPPPPTAMTPTSSQQ